MHSAERIPFFFFTGELFMQSVIMQLLRILGNSTLDCYLFIIN